MSKKTFLSGLLAVGLLVGPGFAATTKGKEKPRKSTQEQILASGTYSAKVKALVCSACGPMVEETMKKMEGIESASVNQEAATLTFTIKKGAKVKKSEIQKGLTAAANQMGMGADFTLTDLQRAKQTSQGRKPMFCCPMGS